MSYPIRGENIPSKFCMANVPLRGKEKIVVNLNSQKIICLSFRSATWKIPTRQTDLMDSDLKSLFDYGSGVSSDAIIKRYPFLHTRRDVINHVRRGIKKLRSCMSVSNSRRYISNNLENSSEVEQ